MMDAQTRSTFNGNVARETPKRLERFASVDDNR
jgi:hypothetical protein